MVRIRRVVRIEQKEKEEEEEEENGELVEVVVEEHRQQETQQPSKYSALEEEEEESEAEEEMLEFENHADETGLRGKLRALPIGSLKTSKEKQGTTRVHRARIKLHRKKKMGHQRTTTTLTITPCLRKSSRRSPGFKIL